MCKPIDEWRRGWRALTAASLGMGVGINLFAMTAGLFIIPMQKEFDWSRRALSIGPIVALCGAFLQPFAGVVIDRFGARRVAIVGLVMLGIAYPLLAISRANPWYFYGVVGMLGLASPIASGVPMLKAVATWFPRNSGLAFGITASGLSVATALALPALAHIISDHGWRAGYLTLFVLVAFLGLPVALAWFRERPRAPIDIPAAHPSPTRALPGVPFGDSLKDIRYWLLILALGSASVPIGGFLSQLQPLLVSRGFTSTQAASIGVGFALAIGISRIGAGKLLDRFTPSRVAAACIALPALGAGLLILTGVTGASWRLTTAAAFLLGLGQGAEIDFIAFFTLKIFGLRDFSVIYGTLGLVVGGGIAIGGLLFAGLFDRFGSYGVALEVAVVAYLCAALFMVMIRVSPSAH